MYRYSLQRLVDTYVVRTAQFGKNVSHDALKFPVLKSRFQIFHKKRMTFKDLAEFFREKHARQRK